MKRNIYEEVDFLNVKEGHEIVFAGKHLNVVSKEIQFDVNRCVLICSDGTIISGSVSTTVFARKGSSVAEKKVSDGCVQNS